MERTARLNILVVNTIDGVRVDWPDGFGLIRASNTTPVLVLRFEGRHLFPGRFRLGRVCCRHGCHAFGHA